MQSQAGRAYSDFLDGFLKRRGYVPEASAELGRKYYRFDVQHPRGDYIKWISRKAKGDYRAAWTNGQVKESMRFRSFTKVLEWLKGTCFIFCEAVEAVHGAALLNFEGDGATGEFGHTHYEAVIWRVEGEKS